MSNEAKWSDEEIIKQIEKSKSNGNVVTSAKKVDHIDKSSTIRHLMVIGCGDGGSMIASRIKNSIPGTYAICYNTSPGAMEKITADVTMVPNAEDGSGKVRQYSKDVFKQGAYKSLIGSVTNALDNHPDIAYIIVCTTADGGTGSGISPMVGKLISDNVSDTYDVPVIILGVYPNISEDATAQFNTMVWQDEVSRTGLPYMIFDNNVPGITNKMQIHDKVNGKIAELLKVITGDIYSNSTISSIDSRDMWMLLKNTGERIVIASNTVRPSTTSNLDAYVEEMLQNNYQPAPSNAKGIGIFVKGPAEMITKLDTSLSTIRATYGDALIQYSHVEEANDICISIIMSGCDEPEDRLYIIKSRYDDIKSSQRKKESSVSKLLGDMENPITLNVNKKSSVEPDLSALDL